MREVAEEDLVLSPRWRQAVIDFFAAGFKPGDVISHDWLEEHFGLDPIEDGQALTIQAHRERQFKWLQAMEAFKTELLERYRVCLVSVFGEGYRVVPPGQQTELATEKFEAEAKRAYRKAAMRLKYVKVEELTEAQRRENVDAIARLSMIQGMQRTIKE